MPRTNLQTLLIIWWTGAALAGASLVIPTYNIYLMVGIMGWIIMLLSTSLIIFMIKKIKNEDKRKELPQNE